MQKFINLLGCINKYVCSFALAGMVLLVFSNTVLRFFKLPNILMAEELVRYLFIWSTFLGVIAVYYHDNHIRVTVLTDHLSPKARNILGLFTNALVIFGLGVLLWGSIEYFSETTAKGQITGIPYKFAVLPIILASACCILIVIRDMLMQYLSLMNPTKV